MLKSASIYRRFHFNGHTLGILILIVPFEKTAEKISFEWLCLKFSSTLPASVIDSESEIKMLRFCVDALLESPCSSLFIHTSREKFAELCLTKKE